MKSQPRQQTENSDRTIGLIHNSLTPSHNSSHMLPYTNLPNLTQSILPSTIIGNPSNLVHRLHNYSTSKVNKKKNRYRIQLLLFSYAGETHINLANQCRYINYKQVI